jgi:transposase InsO family protein
MRAEKDGGMGGERAWRTLDRRYPLRLVRGCVKTWKARDGARARRRVLGNRVSVQVDMRDAAWTIDGTQVGRDVVGHKQALELGRELRSLGYLPAEVGGPQRGRDVIAVMEAGRKARGCLPLVVITDNGPENVNAEVAAYFRRHRIVHMRSAPYVPQHNGWAERGVREVKEAMRCAASFVCTREGKCRDCAAE